MFLGLLHNHLVVLLADTTTEGYVDQDGLYTLHPPCFETVGLEQLEYWVEEGLPNMVHKHHVVPIVPSKYGNSVAKWRFR